MSPTPAARTALLRHSRFFLRRNNFRQASTATEMATKAKDSASESVSKASEGLSRVTSSAGSGVSNAVSGMRSTLSRIGGRTGRLIGFVDSLIPPTIYYARVGLELSKMVFQGQKMAPPSPGQFQTYLQPLINAARHPTSIWSSVSSAASPEGMLSTIRNINTQQLVTVGVVGAELLGFFTVGTMIGKMKIVGYYGEPAHEH